MERYVDSQIIHNGQTMRGLIYHRVSELVNKQLTMIITTTIATARKTKTFCKWRGGERGRVSEIERERESERERECLCVSEYSE